VAEKDDPRPGEGRLARWSRLKREAVADGSKKNPEIRPAPAEAKTAALAPAAPPPEAGATEDQKKKIEDVTKDLPPVEGLGKDSDYAPFMREGVPEETRVAALRKLWRSDPAFAEPFPFEMHMEDYNKTFAPINAATDTVFRAGLGYLIDDDAAKGKQPANEERADNPAPPGIEARNDGKAESYPPPKEEMDKTNMARTAVGEESSQNEKPSSGKSHS
jgi:hypothetical protein